MSGAKQSIGEIQAEQSLAIEVIELGESLFETALESSRHTSAEGEGDVAYPLEELRGAANEFFTALRLLLRIEQ